MLPFGETLYLWRTARGVTQQALARASGLPRPALSTLERGGLDPTLRTIRRVADGLRIPAGWLVDGRLPEPPLRRPWTRPSMRRVISHFINGRPPRSALTRDEQRLAAHWLPQCRCRLRLLGCRPPRRVSKRQQYASWLVLKRLLNRETLSAFYQELDRCEVRAAGIQEP